MDGHTIIIESEERRNAMRRHRRNTQLNYNDYDYYYDLSFIMAGIGERKKNLKVEIECF